MDNESIKGGTLMFIESPNAPTVLFSFVASEELSTDGAEAIVGIPYEVNKSGSTLSWESNYGTNRVTTNATFEGEDLVGVTEYKDADGKSQTYAWVAKAAKSE